jgi:biotin transporter BioY
MAKHCTSGKEYVMFRRAQISFIVAALAGVPILLGMIPQWEAGFRVVCGVSLAFSVISFLLGMFEEETPRPVSVRQASPETVEFAKMELIRVAP